MNGNNFNFSKIKDLLKGIKGLESKLPSKADKKYFEQLEGRIMLKIKDAEVLVACPEVKESLVDFIEGNIPANKKVSIKKHLESCNTCFSEYMITKTVMEDAEHVHVTEACFEELSEKINNEISLCETAQDHIANEYTGDPVPWKIKKHIETCQECQKTVMVTKSIIENLNRLSVPMPNEKFFEEQLHKIDRAIEFSHSSKMERHKEVRGYFTGIMDTLRVTLLQPYAAISISAMVALLIIGGKFYSSKDNIEEKQINLSDLINRANTVTSINEENGLRVTQIKEGIQDPSEDERLQLKTTGSAKCDPVK